MPTKTDRRDDILQALPRGASEEQQILEASIDAMEEAERIREQDYFAREASRFPGMTAEHLRGIAETSEDAFFAIIGRRTPDQESSILGRENDLPAEADSEHGRQWGQTYIGPTENAQWTALYPQLDDDGYQPPSTKIQRAQVVQFVQKGYSRKPKGAFRTPPTLPCDLPGASGGQCAYKGYTDLEVIEHQAARHPRGYMAKQFRLQQRNSQLEQTKTDALIAVMNRITDAPAIDAATVAALKSLAGTGA